MNIKDYVPTFLVMLVVGAGAYMAGDKGLPGQVKAKEVQPQMQAVDSDPMEVRRTILRNVRVVDDSVLDLQVEESPVPGVYWVLLPGNETILVSSDGRYILGRAISEFTPAGVVPVASAMVEEAKKGALAEVRQEFQNTADSQLVYEAKGDKKGEVYVFTDVNCGYCRKFHRDIPELNNAGIEVRYFAGPFYSKDRASLERIWCAEQPLEAMNITKSGQKAPEAEVSAECAEIVTKHIAIGQQLGVQGTPAIYTKDGEKLGGYIPPADLVRRLTQG